MNVDNSAWDRVYPYLSYGFNQEGQRKAGVLKLMKHMKPRKNGHMDHVQHVDQNMEYTHIINIDIRLSKYCPEGFSFYHSYLKNH